MSDVDIQLRLGDRNVNLIEEHVDTALRIDTLPDNNVVAMQEGTICLVVSASPAYLWSGSAIHVSQTNSQPTAASPSMAWSQPIAWTCVDAEGQKRQVQVRSRLAVSTADAAIEAAIVGLGPTRVVS